LVQEIPEIPFITSLCMSPDGNNVLYGDGKQIYVLSLNSQSQLYTSVQSFVAPLQFNGFGNIIKITDDSQFIFYSDRQGSGLTDKVTIRYGSNWNQLFSFHLGPYMNFEISSDGTYLVYVSYNGAENFYQVVGIKINIASASFETIFVGPPFPADASVPSISMTPHIQLLATFFGESLIFYKFSGATWIQSEEIIFPGQCNLNVNLRGKYGIVSTTDNNGRAYLIKDQKYKYELTPVKSIPTGYYGCSIISNSNGDIFVSNPSFPTTGAVYYQFASYFQNDCVEQFFPSTTSSENNPTSDDSSKKIKIERTKNGEEEKFSWRNITFIVVAIIALFIIIIFVIIIMKMAKKNFGKTEYSAVSNN